MTLLAVELRESTRTLHAEAGRSKFMKYFFKGEISMEIYGRFLISYYHVYSALEKALDQNKDNAQLSFIYFPKELSRKSSLEQDLEFYNGPEWRSMLNPITPAQQAYISAIERCSTSTTPELLIAHAYVRYLADLSGGQILSKRLQKYNGIPEDKGVTFYRFDLIEEPDKFKEMFRKRLNQVEISDELRGLIVEEARLAFQRNIDIFQEFDGELEGLPMTRHEQLENLAALEKEKAQLVAEAEAARAKKQADLAASARTGFLASLNPANLWNSLVGTQTVDA
ncbi:heme oxygenase (decycling) 1 [Mortierella sp. AD011]|nr:heme oxygenase (decycling) 1 [Mortierella sp. AD010]KAF9394659.1 heme oxygenase (decycling) 1 [Mortierella sp. AD011]